MVADVRISTLIPRKMARYLELFELHVPPVMRRHGLELMGYHVSHVGPLSQVVPVGLRQPRSGASVRAREADLARECKRTRSCA